ncbi:MAG TPA: secretin N-terminal domain-containing protein [Thermoanaerobaculia bacterium]|nr:secretin N-terminal domain-containing protein [Thermoanaerobaculia bacterium]
MAGTVRRFAAMIVAFLWAGCLSATAQAAPFHAQATPPTQINPGVQGPDRGARGELVLHAYTLRYQQAIEAFQLIRPLLSSRGSIEVQPASNTLVIRDTAAVLARVVPVLRSYDHPAQPLRMEILIVRASRAMVSPQMPSNLPEDLARQLRELLPYQVYQMQAQAQLQTQEGQAVSYELSDDYLVSFRLGTLLEDRIIKLANFEVSRRLPNHKTAVPLVQTNMNLCLDQIWSLGLARSEKSREALFIVMTVHRDDSRPRSER